MAGSGLQIPRPAWIWPAIKTHGWVSPAVGLLKPSCRGEGRRAEGRLEEPREEMEDGSNADLWWRWDGDGGRGGGRRAEGRSEEPR